MAKAYGDKKIEIQIVDFVFSNISVKINTKKIYSEENSFANFIDYYLIDWGDKTENKEGENIEYVFRKQARKCGEDLKLEEERALTMSPKREEKKPVLKLDLTKEHIYKEEGTYMITVKLVDIFGFETTAIKKVKVK